MNYLYSTVNTLRDRYTPVKHQSTFRQTGEITPEEFVCAGDYLVYKFPTWSWGDADGESRRAPHLPAGKQFLVTRSVPCSRRWDGDFAGDAAHEEAVVDDGADFRADGGRRGGDEDGWLRTAGLTSSQPLKARQVREVDESGNVGDSDVMGEDDDIPDMEDDDDDAIIHDGEGSGNRSYNLYIMYSPFYRTPRLYLSGYLPSGQPLAPRLMMEDVVGDYKDKTVTIEDFPFFANYVKMISVHPCKHASVMKTLLDRADSALRERRRKLMAAAASASDSASASASSSAPAAPPTSEAGDEWEEIGGEDEEEVAIRADQYLVVFLKFMASVTPGIEYDLTMGV